MQTGQQLKNNPHLTTICPLVKLNKKITSEFQSRTKACRLYYEAMLCEVNTDCWLLLFQVNSASLDASWLITAAKVCTKGTILGEPNAKPGDFSVFSLGKLVLIPAQLLLFYKQSLSLSALHGTCLLFFFFVPLSNSRLFGPLSSSVLTPVKPLDDPSIPLND